MPPAQWKQAPIACSSPGSLSKERLEHTSARCLVAWIAPDIELRVFINWGAQGPVASLRADRLFLGCKHGTQQPRKTPIDLVAAKIIHVSWAVCSGTHATCLA